MARSTKESWLTGPGDLQEADVEDVPVPGQSVRVRALSARYSAEVQGKLKLTQEGREQVAKIDVRKWNSRSSFTASSTLCSRRLRPGRCRRSSGRRSGR